MILAQSPLVGPDVASRAASFLSVARSAGLCPVAPRARRIPSMTAQSIPAPRDVALSVRANFRDSLSAGGVGSGSCEFSQIVAAFAGPSISGAGAGFRVGRRIDRSVVFFQLRASLLPDFVRCRLAGAAAVFVADMP